MGDDAGQRAATGERIHLVLVGLMGAGKTTVGRTLATRLDRPFLDSDELVEAHAGRTVREIWKDEGEPAFRALERQALGEALASPQPAVVAAAGGSVLDAANRALLRRRGFVVWLRADVEVLEARVGGGGHRPLLDDDPGQTLRRMADDREVLYREVADVVVETDNAEPALVVDRVLEVLP